MSSRLITPFELQLIEACTLIEKALKRLNETSCELPLSAAIPDSYSWMAPIILNLARQLHEVHSASRKLTPFIKILSGRPSILVVSRQATELRNFLEGQREQEAFDHISLRLGDSEAIRSLIEGAIRKDLPSCDALVAFAKRAMPLTVDPRGRPRSFETTLLAAVQFFRRSLNLASSWTWVDERKEFDGEAYLAIRKQLALDGFDPRYAQIVLAEIEGAA